MASQSGNVDLDKQRIRTALVQHIMSLCQVGLSYNVELSVEGLLGITLDKSDIFLINIKEVVSAEQGKSSESVIPGHSASQASEVKRSKRWRKRKHSGDSRSSPDFTHDVPLQDAGSSYDGVKTETPNDSAQLDCASTIDSMNQEWTGNAEDSNGSDNCIVVKEEPGLSTEYGLMRSEYGLAGFADVELAPTMPDMTFCSTSQLSGSKRQRRSSSFVTSHPSVHQAHGSQQAMVHAQHTATPSGLSTGAPHKARRPDAGVHRQEQVRYRKLGSMRHVWFHHSDYTTWW